METALVKTMRNLYILGSYGWVLREFMESVMFKNHDLAKLEQRGFRLEDERVAGKLDGVSAIMLVGEALRVQIYQGCVGVYKLKGQGRGRPKANALVDVEWFEPHWYIRRRDGEEWPKVADGCQVSVDLAVDEAFGYFRRLFPDVPMPAGVALQNPS